MSWQLIRIWHAEVLSTVSASPDAHHFTRTSYLLAPERWLELPPDELHRRTEPLLEARYRRRNHFSAQSGDPAEMRLMCNAFEWVARGAMPADPERDVPGAPADDPTPYGTGIWPRRPVQPRHKAPVPGRG